jgi:hypothetical protein
MKAENSSQYDEMHVEMYILPYTARGVSWVEKMELSTRTWLLIP